MTEDPPAGGPRRVRRGEGEVTEWPRGLADYVPSGEPEGTPSPEEDRDLNRLNIAARLLGTARSKGHNVDDAVGRLREADAAFRRGDRARGRRLVDAVIDTVERLPPTPAPEPGRPPA